MELARAKVATLNAEFATLAGLLHALPLGYQRDLQDDKRPLLNGAQVLVDTVDLAAAVVASTTFNVDEMAAAAEDPGLLAADWAEELVGAGVPFREAYGIIGRLMKEASASEVDPRSIRESELTKLHPALPAALAAVPDAAAAIDRKATAGSPARAALAAQIAAAESLLGS
jgi:argininosuccinate lyase